jgi:hypothetical protein
MRVHSWRFAALPVLLATAACPGPNAGIFGGLAISGPSGAGGGVLAFFREPTGGTADLPIVPAVGVQAQDTLGNLLDTFTGNVTLKLGANTSGATLTGRTTVRASQGLATFDTLVIDRAGVYTLVATASGMDTATSNPFTVFNP